MPHQIGQHFPRPHGREKMPTADGGTVECAKKRKRPPACSQGRATKLLAHPDWGNEEIINYRHFRFQLLKRSIHREWQYSCFPYSMELQPDPAHPQQYLGRFSVESVVQFHRANYRSSLSRCLRPDPMQQRSSRREVFAWGHVPLRLANPTQ